MSGPDSTRRLVDDLFRTRAGQMVAWLTRLFGPEHLDLAEEVVQDALLKALQHWPYAGIPDNPAAWLYRVARNGALDAVRRHAVFRTREADVRAELTRSVADRFDPPDIADDELRMVFMCCHPSLPRDARVALSLKTVGGFSIAEIASNLLTSDAAVTQRIVRAKRTIRELGLTLDLPRGAELMTRLESVLEVVYLLFNEGYNAHAGEHLVRIDLCREALRLGRVVAASPRTGEPAAHALVALMAFHSARLPARVDDAGEVVLLENQDRSVWDRRLIALGFAHLERSAAGARVTAYHVQAAIASLHAEAPDADHTRWRRILDLYDELMAIAPSPVVALNRSVAVARVHGPAAALPEIERLDGAAPLARYYLVAAVKGRLLDELGDAEGAARAYTAALDCSCSDPERRLLQRRLKLLRPTTEPAPRTAD
jgi:RNA polymerase sigma factor (sigma-70 family)